MRQSAGSLGGTNSTQSTTKMAGAPWVRARTRVELEQACIKYGDHDWGDKHGLEAEASTRGGACERWARSAAVLRVRQHTARDARRR